MHRSEKIWLILSFGMILIFMGATGYQAFTYGMAPPGGMERIDPQKVDETPPFDQPGIRQIGENEYEVVMVLQVFSFVPHDIEIPAGSTVHFKLTSKDVIHGFQIVETNANGMVVPGYVTTLTQTFHEPGEYLLMCNEYCGAGHQHMYTTITVK
ncbi:cytochrome c oxidase subunit II [Caldalkalibacillus thermarum TA2.A1]|uniref:Cytochrome aa3 subunit 2 n=1 Tax=Caldalkalibacillus thermarum (strain TA2.A1) TaxID=986075 RepID=F5L5U6_CALTT|nr:cytochrome c oxidase subunit II [Caldalkalibacillus thermarum]EGL83301.1 cytochrome c oxidase subunit II [Caldalkalibacillus thermarum TA2.A1]QZT33216.1 cytochrome c oxidase subunit II [Caldalkalibacillus thermarum TA2.A1]